MAARPSGDRVGCRRRSRAAALPCRGALPGVAVRRASQRNGWTHGPPVTAVPCAYVYTTPPRCTMPRLRIWDAYHGQWVLWTDRVCEWWATERTPALRPTRWLCEALWGAEHRWQVF